MTMGLALGPGDGHPFLLPTRGHGAVKLSTADTDGVLTALELVMGPGEGPGRHVHRREHELWYVLEGEFRFLLGEELFHQAQGGVAFGPRDVPHTFQNVGAGTGRLLVVTGPAGVEEFFLTYDRCASGHFDAAALEAAAQVAGIEFFGPPLGVSHPVA